MRKLRTYIFAAGVAALAFSLAPTAPAQEAPPAPRPEARKRLAHGERLGLTADQRSQMDAIRKDMREQARAIHDDAALTAEQRRDRMRALRGTAQERIQAVLTPEQRERAAEMRDQALFHAFMRDGRHQRKMFRKHRMQARMHHRMARRMHHGMGPGMRHGIRSQVHALELSEAQRADWRKIHDEQREKMRALHQDAALTQEQKMERMKALRDEIHGRLGAVLTAEQKQKFDEHRRQMEQRREKMKGMKGKMKERMKPSGPGGPGGPPEETERH